MLLDIIIYCTKGRVCNDEKIQKIPYAFNKPCINWVPDFSPPEKDPCASF